MFIRPCSLHGLFLSFLDRYLIFAIHFRVGYGAVAQLVEQRTENPCVGGSIPPHTTEKNTKPL